MQAARDLLQPRSEIDGGPNAGEVEPAYAADIAEQDVTNMQRHTKTKAFDLIAARIVHGIDIGGGLAARFKRAAADLGEISAVLRDRKHGKQPVAHEFQDFATVLADGWHLAIEIPVEGGPASFAPKRYGKHVQPGQVG